MLSSNRVGEGASPELRGFPMTAHRRMWLPAVNEGELAVIYCFVFLFFAAHGSGLLALGARRVPAAGRDARLTTAGSEAR